MLLSAIVVIVGLILAVIYLPGLILGAAASALGGAAKGAAKGAVSTAGAAGRVIIGATGALIGSGSSDDEIIDVTYSDGTTWKVRKSGSGPTGEKYYTDVNTGKTYMKP